MAIRYSAHLISRLSLRGIPEGMPRMIFLEADRRFTDAVSGLTIAVRRTRYFGRMREVMVAYRRRNGDVLLVTIHPLKVGQMENRIRSGRWRPL